MKKFISAVSAVALLISSIPAMNTVSEVSAEDDAIKIMCIGDSITDGYTSEYVGSYRKFICHNLMTMGYNIDMVGAKESEWASSYTDEETGETWSFDNDNTGYSGYAIKEYSGRSGIYETLISTDCLAKTKPDIVTLQIGTNDVIDNHDIDTAGERLEVLVDYILDNIPQDATLFISPIPPLDPNRSEVYDWFGNYRHSSDWSEQYDDAMAKMNVEISLMQYNTQVMAVASKKKQEGRNVVFSEAAFEITDVETQLFDGVHPNNAGYKAMGEKWVEIIDKYLTENSPAESTTTFEVTTTTETATTTQTTTTDFVLIPIVTTTTTEGNTTFNIGDLVKLIHYVLDCPIAYEEDEIKRYDLNNDGGIDVFDVILMRGAVIGNVEKLLEKRKELGDDKFLDLSDACNIVIYPDEYYETTTTTTAPKKAIASEITELDKPDRTEENIIIDWENNSILS
ncbi:MAG: hypothetical protein K2K91_03590 [Ruminococcus sp.]|nr:hypothetical protein [Ruminococcus sp.]